MLYVTYKANGKLQNTSGGKYRSGCLFPCEPANLVPRKLGYLAGKLEVSQTEKKLFWSFTILPMHLSITATCALFCIHMRVWIYDAYVTLYVSYVRRTSHHDLMNSTIIFHSDVQSILETKFNHDKPCHKYEVLRLHVSFYKQPHFHVKPLVAKDNPWF